MGMDELDQPRKQVFLQTPGTGEWSHSSGPSGLRLSLVLLPHADMGELSRGCQRVDVADKGQPRGHGVDGEGRGVIDGQTLLRQLADPQSEEQQEECT